MVAKLEARDSALGAGGNNPRPEGVILNVVVMDTKFCMMTQTLTSKMYLMS